MNFRTEMRHAKIGRSVELYGRKVVPMLGKLGYRYGASARGRSPCSPELQSGSGRVLEQSLFR